jgi:hypothetical protein
VSRLLGSARTKIITSVGIGIAVSAWERGSKKRKPRPGGVLLTSSQQ